MANTQSITLTEIHFLLHLCYCYATLLPLFPKYFFLNTAAFALYCNTEKILFLLSKSIRREEEKGKESSNGIQNTTSTVAPNIK